jgi:hypothetical protein
MEQEEEYNIQVKEDKATTLFQETKKLASLDLVILDIHKHL